MKILLPGLLLLGSGALMNASIIFTVGNNPQTNEQNVLLGSGTSGTTVTGTLNQSPGVTVNFTSSQMLLEPSSGQARVTGSPEGTALNSVTVSLANNLTYQDLIINPFLGGAGGCSGCTIGGAFNVSVTPVLNGTVESASTFSVPGGITNGSNFLTIVATGGESILSTTINTPGGINDLRQPRISGPFTPLTSGPTGTTGPTGTSGPTGSTVPEPGTYLLMSSGLLAFGLLRKRMFAK